MSSAVTSPPNSAVAGVTVPELARLCDEPLDRLRFKIRKHPPLAGLLVRAGPLRVLPPERLEEFRAALSSISSTRSSPACPPSSAT
jgi:hypothetical protein